MADEVLKRDQNHITVLGGITDDSNQFIKMLRVDPTTKRLLVSATSSGAGVTSINTLTGAVILAAGTGITLTPVGNTITIASTGGTGTVTSVSVTTANGVSGSVATATTTPAITITLGAITPTTVNGLTITANGTNTLNISAGKTVVHSASTTFAGTDGKTLTISNTGTLAGGDAFVLAIAAGKTLTVSNSITLAGTDATVMTFPTTSATIARTDAGQTFTGVQVFTTPTITTANLNGTQLLAENASIGLDPAGSADGKFTGITVTAVSGYAQAFGDLVYLDPTDSRWEQCDANSAAGADGDSRGIIGMVVVAGTDGNACTILLNGIIRADAKFPSFTINNPIYVSETAGAVTQTQPVTTDVVIRIVGFAITADEIYFNPDGTYITHT